MNPPYGVPLELGNAVADPDNAHSHFTRPEKICKTCHKTAVDGRHQLHDVGSGASCRREREPFIIGKPVQIGIRQSECHRITESPGGGDIVYNLVFLHTDEFIAEFLEIVLGCKRKLVEVFNFLD